MARGVIVDKSGNVIEVLEAASDDDPNYSTAGAFVVSDVAVVGDLYDKQLSTFTTTEKSQPPLPNFVALRIAMAEFGLTEDAIDRIFIAAR